MAQIKRGWIYGGLVAIVAIAWFATAPQETVKKGAIGKRPDRTNSKTKSRRGQNEEFTEEDTKAEYNRYEGNVANVFIPLVKRTNAGKSGAASTSAPNQIPAYLVGGDTGWLYTGTAYIDSVPSALIENTTKGDGQYLKVGETFRNFKVVKITPNSLVISDSEALTTTTLTLIENRPIVDDTNLVSRSNNQPLNPMSGQIGLNASQDKNNSQPNATQNSALSTDNRSRNKHDSETTNSETPN